MEKLLFTTQSNPKLAKAIAAKTDLRLGKCEIGRFIDQEISVRLKESVKNKEVYVLGSSFPPAENFLELIILINTLKINGAKKITAIIPYFGYSRSDHMYLPGTPINARLLAQIIGLTGAEKIFIIDPHSPKIKEFFSIPVKTVSMLPFFAEHIKKQEIKNYIVTSPDLGGIPRVKALASLLKIKEIAVIKKYHPSPEKVEMTKILGNVKDKNIIIIDDMIQSGNTIIKAAEILKKCGVKNIYVYITHLISPMSAIERLQKSEYISQIIITNTVPPLLKKLPNKFKILKVDELVIKSIAKN